VRSSENLDKGPDAKDKASVPAGKSPDNIASHKQVSKGAPSQQTTVMNFSPERNMAMELLQEGSWIFQSPLKALPENVSFTDLDYNEQELMRCMSNVIFDYCKFTSSQAQPTINSLEPQKRPIRPSYPFMLFMMEELQSLYGDNELQDEANNGDDDVKLILTDMCGGMFHHMYGELVEALAAMRPTEFNGVEGPSYPKMDKRGIVKDTYHMLPDFTYDMQVMTSFDDVCGTIQDGRTDLYPAKSGPVASAQWSGVVSNELWQALSLCSHKTSAYAIHMQIISHAYVAIQDSVEWVCEPTFDVVRAFNGSGMFGPFLFKRYGKHYNARPPDLEDIYAFLSWSDVSVSISHPYYAAISDAGDNYQRRLLYHRVHYPLQSNNVRSPSFYLLWASDTPSYTTSFHSGTAIRPLVPLDHVPSSKSTIAPFDFGVNQTVCTYHWENHNQATFLPVFRPAPAHFKPSMIRHQLLQTVAFQDRSYCCAITCGEVPVYTERMEELESAIIKGGNERCACASGHICLKIESGTGSIGTVDLNKAFQVKGCFAKELFRTNNGSLPRDDINMLLNIGKLWNKFGSAMILFAGKKSKQEHSKYLNETKNLPGGWNSELEKLKAESLARYNKYNDEYSPPNHHLETWFDKSCYWQSYLDQTKANVMRKSQNVVPITLEDDSPIEFQTSPAMKDKLRKMMKAVKKDLTQKMPKKPEGQDAIETQPTLTQERIVPPPPPLVKRPSPKRVITSDNLEVISFM
jgi:hypothetical protein